MTECLKYESAIEEAFVKLDILTSERPLDKNLAFILTTELLFGKKTLPGESKPVETIMKYHETTLEDAKGRFGHVPVLASKNSHYRKK